MAERGTVNYSILVKREGERLLECLKDSSLGIISCIGWNGVGRWGVAEYATKIAMESHLFDILVWVNLPRNEWTSRRKLQMRIAECLGIQSPTMYVEGRHVESETDIHTAVQIYEKLKARKFLLVVGGASLKCEHTNLERIGVPNVRRRSSSVSNLLSKVVLIGKWINIKVDKELEIEFYFMRNMSSVSDLWDLICEEANLAARSLSTNGYFSSNNVIDCLLYFSLSFFHGYKFYYDFASHKEWMIRYWIAEELIGGEMENEEVLLEIVDALQTELEDRSILDWNNESMTVRMKGILSLGVAGRVPNLHHRFWIKTDSLPKENDDGDGWGSIQRMSLLITRSIGISLPPSPKSPNLSTLILRYVRVLLLELPQTFFDHMKNLRVLDLACTPIGSLPSSLSSLCNLKLLMLRSCRKLVSLPTSLKYLAKLKFLGLSYCDSLRVIPEESFELMDKLQILDLSKTPIHSLPSSVSNLHSLQQLLLCCCSELTHIPEKCFERMSHLHVLDLSSATSLKSIPSSLSNLGNLKKLNLSKCTSLETGVPPRSLKNLSSLEMLDLSKCERLEDIRDASFQHIMPKLQQVCISSTHTPYRLSFRACQSIETLYLSDLSNLEVLDLSGTKLKKIHLTSSNGYSLKHLDILPLSDSDILFRELNWQDDDVGSRIWVIDPNFFQSTFYVSKKIFEAPCFLRFYIRISPYEEEGGLAMTLDKFQNIHLKKSPFVYKEICRSHIQTHIFPHLKSRRACRRHLEIFGGNSSPRGVAEILAHTEVITMLFHNFVERLSDLCNVEELNVLKECRIGSCQMIKNAFSGDATDSNILRSLHVIWASDLPQLTALMGGHYGGKSFGFLKHIYLEHCPKLETLFTSGVYLQSLETLEIKFCSRLVSVFQQEVLGGKGQLHNLRRLYLLQAPKLKSVCTGFLPQLEKVHVRRCPKLRKLPIQVHLVDRGSEASSSSLSYPPVMEIRGEMAWWKNLEWNNEDDSVKHPAHFRPWKHAPTILRHR